MISRGYYISERLQKQTLGQVYLSSYISDTKEYTKSDYISGVGKYYITGTAEMNF